MPFHHIEVKENTKCFSCCSFWIKEDFGNLTEQSIDQIWNSEKAQKIRASILDGSFSYCHKDRCPELIGDTLPNIDDITDPYYMDIIENKKTKLEYGPKWITHSLDNTCNLTCPSCRDEIININKYHKETTESLQDMSKLNGVGTLTLSGTGDPFSSKAYRTFLETFDPNKHPGLELMLMTNGVMMTPKQLSKMETALPHIDKVLISLDAGTKEVYDIVRRGGKWQTVLDNVKYLKTISKKYNIEIVLCMVLQYVNYKTIPEFIQIAEELDIGIDLTRYMQWDHIPNVIFDNNNIFDKTHPEYSKFMKIYNNLDKRYKQMIDKLF